MQIVQLDEKIYKNQPFTVKYRTKGYYDIRRSGTTFSLEYVPFGEEKELSFDDKLLSDWLDHPIALGAFEGEAMLGFVEGFHESGTTAAGSAISIFSRETGGAGPAAR